MDFTETVAKIKSVPRYAGSKDEPHLFYITEGVHQKSVNFHLQYGAGNKRWNMHVRACSSKAAILQCSSADSKANPCKGTAKIAILDPKLIIVEKKENVKKPRNIFKLNYDHPDVKDIKKYGQVTTTKKHCESCKPSLRYHVIQREFRSNNGKVSVSLNSDQSKIQYDNSNFIIHKDKLTVEAGISVRKEQFSALKKIQKSSGYTVSDIVPENCAHLTLIDPAHPS